MNYEESLRYIHSINWAFCKPGLERITKLCEALGNPQDHLRFIHVAGTNGKGSTCAMLESILRHAGYRTGLYTSPYIVSFNERMRVNGVNIDNNTLAEITTRIRPIADAMEDKPTEFELITAVAFEYFYRSGCDVVVLEVGLGGRLDSTNIIKNPLLSIITGIDFDHTGLLGNTIQEIAVEKAGIVKEGCQVLYGGVENAACRTIRSITEHRHAFFHTVDRSSYVKKSATLDGTVFDYLDYTDLNLSLLGAYQPYNATLVLTAIGLLTEQCGFTVPEEAIREGLAKVKWQARFELLSADPIILYDGGHNPEGVNAAVKSIREYFPEQKVLLLSGVMEDKDYDSMIEELKAVTAHAFTVTPDNPRALKAVEYATAFQNHKVPASAYESVEEGVRAAVEASRAENVPLICLGSLYLYHDVADAVRRVLN
ncbi:MAG: bifunctional folylpolyglutamate synthase/dihydrofolate synthase [Clostridia bacterium]|nr:bifunctional folylpolyglutamate synthase/dihydrofolate synthase [Clostridia bacterium]